MQKVYEVWAKGEYHYIYAIDKMDAERLIAKEVGLTTTRHVFAEEIPIKDVPLISMPKTD